MPRKLVLVLVLIVIAGLATLVYLKKAPTGNPDVVPVSGNIEVTDVELSFRIAGWVKARPGSEGQTVRAGQVIAQLDETELSHEVALRKAEVEAAQAALAEMEAGSRPQEIASAEATVQAALADNDRRKTDFARVKSLREKGVAALDEYDVARTALDTAAAHLTEAQEKLKLVKEGPRKEQIEQARARLEQARQTLAMTQTRLDYSTLTSPIDGMVMSENVEAGEFVVPGTPVVTVADIKNVYLRAYVNEPDLPRVKLGQQVHVYIDTPKGRQTYTGVVAFISPEAEFTPKTVQTQKERVKLVYRLKINIPNPNMDLKPGMPADADILAGPSQ